MPLARALARLAVVPVVLVAACNRSTPSAVSSAPALTSLGYAPVADIGGGNALTLPAQRHLVRIGSTLLLALQQDGAGALGLGMFRSDDDGASFSRIGPIQGDPSHRDTADMLVVGQDIALVYSYEGPTLSGSTAHDVYFQWWRHRNGTWSPDPAVRIFDSTSSANGYYRAELAIDSLGRYWVQAFYLESDGSATAHITVSTDGGASFTEQPTLGNLPYRGGGRLLSVGTRLVFVYDGHDDGTHPAHYRVRDDSAPLGSWQPDTIAFDEGIYHGAACSAVADGHGGMHLVYKDKNMVLWYRYFDGSTFGPATQLENVGDWELQPATTRIGDDLVVFYNRVWTTNTNDEVRVRTLRAGTWSAPTVLDSSGGFKGYPASIDVLPTSTTDVHCLFGDTPDADSGGQATIYTVSWNATTSPGDMATAPADLATSGGTTLVFSDSFGRNIAPDDGLGAQWSIGAGAWFANGSGVADIDGSDLAAENVGVCSDCKAQASVTTFGTAGGVYVRAPSPTSGDRYDFVLVPSGHVQIRRVRGGAVTVLGDVASGVGAFDAPTTLTLTATGASPVTLVGSVGGATRLTVTDASSAALTGAGYSGLWSSSAGVPFDDYSLWSLGSGGGGSGGSGGGSSDMAIANDMAIPRDMAMPPDIATPRDMATPRDLATPPDLATAPADMATTSGPLFSDSFGRNIAPDDGLGAQWSIGAGAWFANGSGVADLDGGDLAAENVTSCRDCTVQASVTTFGTAGGVYVRAPSPTSGDRYDFVLVSSGHVQIRRVRSGAVTVLGDVPSGVGEFDVPTVLSLSATGSSPVSLVGSVNGAATLTVTDGSSAALTTAGYAGLWASSAGVPFDDFALSGTSLSGTGGSGGGGGGGSGGGGGGSGGGSFGLQVTYTDTQHLLLAIDPAGTAYATLISDGSGTHVYASTDARTWTLRGTHAAGELDIMTALSDGTLLADSFEAAGHVITRSTDHGATWHDVLSQGQYRSLTPHSFAELDGTVYFIQYQTFSQDATPINLYASTDGGVTWSVRYTFQGHRHGHGIIADKSAHVLWALFGDTDAQSGIYRSTDGGNSWTFMLGNQDGDVVDGTPLAGGGLLFGQDISFLPTKPAVAKLTASGQYTILAPIIGPSYSIHALALGGYVVGSERESNGDIYPPGEISAHIYGSADGVTWTKLLDYPWLDPNNDYVRADVYWELPSTHELVVTLYNAAGYGGANGQGYQLVRRQ